MEVAMISPIPLLGFSRTSTIHLILPELLDNEEYVKYVREVKENGDYLILDNGAAEGKSITWTKFMELATEYDVDEVVIPDTMMDMEMTTYAVRAFEPYAQAIRAVLPEVKFGAVIQGKNMHEWVKALHMYTSHEEFSYPEVLYFPRCMNYQWGNQRVSFLQSAFSAGLLGGAQSVLPKKEVHCLGASGWTREAAALAELPVRSMDTSMPIVYGLALKSLKVTHDYIPRPDGYFEMKADQVQWEHIDDNIWTYYSWAGYQPFIDVTDDPSSAG